MLRYLSTIICLTLLSLLFLSSTALAQKALSVQVKEGQLRATPSHLGKIVAQVSYGDRVTVLAEQGDWKKVATAGGRSQGWMHNTALTNSRIALRAGQADVGSSVSRDEIALAGKGFSEEVEAQYRKSHKNLDYAWINKMETIKVSPEQIEDFLSKGSLAPVGEGGRP